MYKYNISLYNHKYCLYKRNSISYVYIYNKYYFIILKINPEIKIFIINNKKFQFWFKTSLMLKNVIILKKFIDQFELYAYTKIKLAGKGYKIKKNKKSSMVLLFNKAHPTIICWRHIFLKKFKKYKFYLKCTNTTLNKHITKKIQNVRFVNVFTKKGLKLSRQLLLKKKGKKS